MPPMEEAGSGHYYPSTPLDAPHGPAIPLHADVLLSKAAENIAFARAHLTNAETTFEQLKQALGR